MKKISFDEDSTKTIGWKPLSFLKSFLAKGKKTKIIFAFLVVLAVFLVVFGVLPAKKTLERAKEVYPKALGIYAGFQNQNLEEINQNIQVTKDQLTETHNQFQKLGWTKYIPFFGNYYRDAERLLKAGFYGLDAAGIAVESLKPYADLLGFEGGKGFADKTAEERVIFVAKTLEKISPELEKISEKINLVRSEVKEINPKRYPKNIRGLEVREKITLMQETVDQLANSLSQLKPAIAILPQLLGEPDEKHYLLLFQNDAELRPTGGFMTAYAILRVHHGKITPLKSEDIYGLDARFSSKIEAPEALINYVKLPYGEESRSGVKPKWRIRDMNLSPDFKEAMDLFSENYFTTANATEIDGIVAIDTSLPVQLLEILGQIGVPGWGNFSAEDDPRCNCPQVIYELERLADQPVSTLRTGRKAVLGPLMHSILANMMGSPRKLWPEFFNVLVESINQKRLLLYFFDEEAQKAADNFRASARIKDYDGDYLHINDCSFSGAKSNMFIKEAVTQEIEIGEAGTVTKTVTIDYKNPEPASDCNLERGDLCLNAAYRDWLRIYVPKGSELIEFIGSEVEVKTYEELGKTVFEGFFGDQHPLRPEGSAKVVLKYKLPFRIQNGEDYRLLIQKQPGTYGYEYTVKVNGEEIEGFDLLTDREIKFEV
jgi:hypothetical protein